MFLSKTKGVKRRLTSSDLSDDELSDSKRPRRSKRVVGKTKKERNWKIPKIFRDETRPYATKAMKFYNKKTERMYELVEPGFIKTMLLSKCILHHIDFIAKKTNVVDAPEEMFFAELKTSRGITTVRCCMSMGPSDSISGDKMNGCYYCCESQFVQHPKSGGFTRGGDGLFRTDL